ncbi:MAG: hypothetical protein K0Q87_1601 [Neobacillus sp.]|jgi:hypothetical protein|nr:hypothetical protein [Neobacillus sp.]
MKQRFHIRDILSVITGKVVATRHVNCKVKGTLNFDKARKTELIEKNVWDVLKKLTQEHDIKVDVDSNYSFGRIVIKIKD